MYFSANCMIRGGRAARIWPNCEFVISVLANGVGVKPGLKLFVTLKTSQRNSIRWDSFNWKYRDSPISKSNWCGSFTVLVPAFPNVPTAGLVYASLFSQTALAPAGNAGPLQ